MAAPLQRATISQNLRDAGCDEAFISEFMNLVEWKLIDEQLTQLKNYRVTLLSQLHADQRKLECLDYLIYSIRSAT